MASCSNCGATFGCGCNLINGLCHPCNNKINGSNTQQLLVATSSSNVPANTEFNEILNTQGLTKEDKLRRINDILQKAIDNANS